MADTLTIAISAETADRLRRSAEETGETAEALASRLVEEGAADLDEPLESLLTPAQIADLEERLRNPTRLATDEEVEAFFARFMPKK